MQVIITIPDEFITDWNKDRFDDALHRLSADAHLIAGNYEQETAKMLAEAFKNAAQPDLVRCNECEYGAQDEVGRWFCRSLGCQIGNEDGSGYCADAERRTND